MTINVGDRVNERYRILAPIGQGGMGSVYEALDELTGKRCALKEARLDGLPTEEDTRIRPERQGSQAPPVLTREYAVRLFKHEAKMLRDLDHPGLPRVSDDFVTPEGAFLAMDLIEGDDLSQQLEARGGRPFPESDVMT